MVEGLACTALPHLGVEVAYVLKPGRTVCRDLDLDVYVRNVFIHNTIVITLFKYLHDTFLFGIYRMFTIPDSFRITIISYNHI